MSAANVLKINQRLLSNGIKVYRNINQSKVLSSFYLQHYGQYNYSTQPTATANSSSGLSLSFRFGRIASALRTHITRYMVQGNAVKNLYECCAEDIDYVEFFRMCDMPDTFQSWFYVLQLHIWMILVRFKPEGKHGKRLSYHLVEILWKDLEERIKLLGIVDTSEKKETMEEYAQQFLGLIVAYDEGLIGCDKTLASALWRNMFYGKDTTDPEQLAFLVGYVRKQIQYLEMQDSGHLLLTGNVKWLPLHDEVES